METQNEIFKKYYYSDDNILSNNDLWKNRILKDPNFNSKTKKKDFDDWLAKQETHQIEKTIHKPVSNLTHPIIAQVDTYQSDLMYYDSLAGVNKGFSAIINFIEITTRKAFSYPLKSKTADEVMIAFLDFFSKVKIIRCLEIDAGSEYSKVIKYCNENEIQTIIYNNDKNSMSIAERFNRSLRNFIKKVCKDRIWINKLPIILKAYNEKEHSSTGYSPDYLSEHPKIQDDIRGLSVQQQVDAKKELHKFKIGDVVKVYEKRTIFGKGSGSFSATNHTITAINGNSIFLDHNPTKKYRYYSVKKVGHSDPDPRVVKNDEADIEELNYHVARTLKKDLAPELTVKQFNKKLQEQVNDDTLGTGKRSKKQAKITNISYV